MTEQEKIHRLAKSDKVEERREAAEQLRDNFALLPDKKQAWEDLHRLTQDKSKYVRWGAASALGSAFPHIPEKRRWKQNRVLLSFLLPERKVCRCKYHPGTDDR